MILDLEMVTSGDRITGDEVVVFRDVTGEDNRIRCRVALEVRRSDHMFYVHADVSGSFATPCHRCLDPASCTVVSSFDLVVQKADPHSSPGPAPTDEGFVVLPAGENRLELGAYIHESLVLDIPMQILCSETCKGLCSGCGANLNRESCRCEATADPRWNELKRLQDGSPE